MKLGKILETKADREIADCVMKKIRNADTHNIYYDPNIECNFIMFNSDMYKEYNTNKYVRKIVDKELERMDAWAFVANISNGYMRVKALKICWLPTTSRQFRKMEEFHRNVTRHQHNKRVLKMIDAGFKLHNIIPEVSMEEHTAKYLASKGYVCRQDYVNQWTIYKEEPQSAIIFRASF